MEYRPLEIILISADGIKNVNKFGKMDVYAVAFIFGYPQTKKTTQVDKNCGTSPRWNQKLHFTIDERSLSNPGLTLLIQLKADKSFRSDKDIGEVAVPLPELFKNANESRTAAAERVVEYQVRASSGKPEGTLKFSYKFGDKLSYGNAETKKADEPITAYPPPGYKQGQAGASIPAAAAAMAYPSPHAGMGYQQPPPGGYPGYAQPPPYGAYPPSGGYPHSGYGYAPPPSYGYQQTVQPPKKKKNGMGMGLGLGAGLLGGMLIGDMVSDMGEMAAYNDGYGDAMGDMGDFDF